MSIITVHATKGGQGVTTIATTLALLTARTQHTLLIDTAGDIAPMLALPEPDHPGLGDYLHDPTITLTNITTCVDHDLDLITPGDRPTIFDAHTYGLLVGGLGRYDTVIIDTATHAPAWDVLADHTILVIRPDYLALRRALQLPRRPDDLIVVVEPGRALSVDDIEAALGQPVTATIPLDPAIARINDAGLFATRLPRTITRAIHQLTPNPPTITPISTIPVAGVTR